MKFYVLGIVREVINPEPEEPPYLVPAFTNKRKAIRFAKKHKAEIVSVLATVQKEAR